MNYQTIYEIASEPVQGVLQMIYVSPKLMLLTLMLVALIAIVIFAWSPLYDLLMRVVLSKFPPKLGNPYYAVLVLEGKQAASALLGVVFSVFVLCFSFHFQANRHLEADYRQGKLPIIEGVVRGFRFSPGSRFLPASVAFLLDDHEIHYSENAFGFALAKENVLSDGARVRLWVNDEPTTKTDRAARINPLTSWFYGDSVSIARIDIAR